MLSQWLGVLFEQEDFLDSFHQGFGVLRGDGETHFKDIRLGDVGGSIAKPQFALIHHAGGSVGLSHGDTLDGVADFAEAAKGVRFYDKARNIEFFGSAEKGEALDLINMGNKIWGGFQKMKMDVNYGNLVDLDYLDPK